MKYLSTKKIFVTAVIAAVALVTGYTRDASAHCDTLDGPVIKDARTALEKNDVTPVLKWVRKDKEAEVKKQFNAAVAARKKDVKAGEKAEMHFFELLVKIHRAGEGAAFTGLKPAGAVEPSVAAADAALQSGNADALVKLVADAAAKGIGERFAKVSEAGKHKDESVEKGREFVEAYVDYTHYVERLHMLAESKTGHSGSEKTGKHEMHQIHKKQEKHEKHHGH